MDMQEDWCKTATQEVRQINNKVQQLHLIAG